MEFQRRSEAAQSGLFETSYFRSYTWQADDDHEGRRENKARS
jgi:hypothetical protein